VGLRAGLDSVVQEVSSQTLLGIEPRSSSRSLVTVVMTELRRLLDNKAPMEVCGCKTGDVREVGC